MSSASPTSATDTSDADAQATDAAAASLTASITATSPTHDPDKAPNPEASAADGAPPEPKAQPVMTEDHPTDADGDNPFLRNLVEAMRHVAEETRSKSVVELRASVDDHIRELRSASEDRAGAMRKLAEDEVAAVSAWEEAEIERVRTEAQRRSEERRARLDTEVAEDAAQTERDIDQTKERATAYEGELDTFLAKLAEIRDPAEFVSTAQRMPPPPLASSSGEAEATAVRSRLAALGAERSAAAPTPRPAATEAVAADVNAAGMNGTPAGSAAEPVAPEQEAVEAPASEPAAEVSAVETASEPVAEVPAAMAASEPAAETATSVIVKGLGSFGAITSFKQSLERAPGIRSVALSLGPTGEFVYRATHAAETDLAAALATIEEGSTVERQSDGSLRVTVGRPR